MTLLKRIMWPRVGEDVTIYRDGAVIAEGHVIYSGADVVTILGSKAITVTLNVRELQQGIDTRAVVVKKKARV